MPMPGTDLGQLAFNCPSYSKTLMLVPVIHGEDTKISLLESVSTLATIVSVSANPPWTAWGQPSFPYVLNLTSTSLLSWPSESATVNLTAYKLEVIFDKSSVPRTPSLTSLLECAANVHLLGSIPSPYSNV